ncbi:lipopolysaccharide-induced tumor necrosis factor-alpha factor-like [Cataglyphis hispanica]|uniref:lipopolysaccharide-induced tumor necrosis factor-alpha factor-like n=1 Tax=Cataglyphis hispanica TaxID=1086592 RepID=UPI0021808875|nr:lipopolysaccharide-induced tumor necrosis factor-alpha factor-like [Cataglyphis hispanica]XP_050444998.1 lipopolysaccharide-induced tumor necrosis factor-alpha factor-like [Cataglyphis hispanica]
MEQPPSYPPPPLPQQPNIITTSQGFGSHSQHLICPHCHANISTRVETEANAGAYLIGIFFCICICIAFICMHATHNVSPPDSSCHPYSCDCCLETKHYCPECGSYLGSSNNC